MHPISKNMHRQDISLKCRNNESTSSRKDAEPERYRAGKMQYRKDSERKDTEPDRHRAGKIQYRKDAEPERYSTGRMQKRDEVVKYM